MNKKLISILLASTMVLSLAACGGKKEEEKKPEQPSAGGKGKIAYCCSNLGDKSFNDSGETGMNILRSEGWDVKTVEIGDDSKADKWTDIYLDLIDQGYQYIVGASGQGDYFLPLTADHPDVHFLVFDDIRDEDKLAPNMSSIFYAQNEGSYLVGMLAAGMSKTHAVAVNVGQINPVINDFVTGFINGAKDYDPNCTVVTAACGSWADPALMKTLCLDQQRNNNVDVFYQVAGGSGDGLFDAAMETGSWAIGVDSDQWQAYKDGSNPEKADVILTSMLKEVGNSFVAFFHQVEAGDDVWGKNITLGLKDDSVGYVDNDFFKEKVPEDLRNAMADAAKKVKEGSLDVKSYYDFKDEAEYQAYVDAAK